MRRLFALAMLLLVMACSSRPRPKEPARELDIPPVQALAATPDAGPPLDASEEQAAIPVTADDAVRGPRDALVTVVLFSDFQCPFCARLAPTLDEVRKHYGDDVRIVFKNQALPFHPLAKIAAAIGQGVLASRGQGAFWHFHDEVYRRQSDLMTKEGLRQAAEDAGVSGPELDAGLEGRAWDEKVARDMALATRVGAVGTPTMFLNGVLLSGAQSYDRIASEVDARVAQARSLLAAGTTRGGLYRIATAANYKDAPQRKDPDDDGASADTRTVWKVPAVGAPSRGNAKALVTIVEFGDFQCPFTKRVQSTLDDLRTKYGDQLRIVWRDQPLPFHPRALPAASIARSARAQKGDAAFWTVHDGLFASQPALEDADLERVARTSGIDASKAIATIKSSTYKAAIATDVSTAKEVTASGTPTFFINGRRLVGAQHAPAFEKIIDEEILHAKAELAKGVAPASLYESMVKNGKTVSAPATTTMTTTKAGPPTGLVVHDVTVGTGRAVAAGNKVSVHYVGSLADGTEFDSSRKRGSPFSFVVGKGTVIKGWDAGVPGMKVGGKRTLTIPPDLGYGTRGSGEKIPPDATLRFEIELLSIE